LAEFPTIFARIPPVIVLHRPHRRRDLPGYIEHRLARAGIGTLQQARYDTVAEEERFFSYRRSCLRGERAYGRALSAIVLKQ
jgi:copper oxidase (laccase) domain-containing protein